MCSRYRIELAPLLLGLLCGCSSGSLQGMPAEQPDRQGVIDTALDPGVDRSLVTVDPRAAAYYDNAEAVNTGKRLFGQYNCSGCHSNGGGGMGPALMDDEWDLWRAPGADSSDPGRGTPQWYARMGWQGAGSAVVAAGGLCALDVLAPDAGRAKRRDTVAIPGPGAARGRSGFRLVGTGEHHQSLHHHDYRAAVIRLALLLLIVSAPALTAAFTGPLLLAGW